MAILKHLKICRILVVIKIVAVVVVAVVAAVLVVRKKIKWLKNKKVQYSVEMPTQLVPYLRSTHLLYVTVLVLSKQSDVDQCPKTWM